MNSEITEGTKVLVAAEVHRVDPPWARVLLHPFSSVSTPVSQSSLIPLEALRDVLRIAKGDAETVATEVCMNAEERMPVYAHIERVGTLLSTLDEIAGTPKEGG